MINKLFLVIRLCLGVLFIVSGLEKVISPSQNFLYVIQAYDLLPDVLAKTASLVFPWVELFIGIFLFLGLWSEWALKALFLVSASLIIMVGQAIIRKLPIDSCGCFGELVHLPLGGVIILDVTILVLTILSLKNLDKVRWLSLDAFYNKKEQ